MEDKHDWKKIKESVEFFSIAIKEIKVTDYNLPVIKKHMEILKEFENKNISYKDFNYLINFPLAGGQEVVKSLTIIFNLNDNRKLKTIKTIIQEWKRN